MFLPRPALGQEDCLECHRESKKVTSASGAPRSIFADTDAIKASPHAGLKCLDCHPDAKLTSEIEMDTELDVSKPLHKSPTSPVACGACHKSQNFDHKKSAHGQAQAANNPDAPTCRQCHGAHEIKKASAPDSPVNRAKSPFLCGACHSEGKPVRHAYRISAGNVAANYPEKIHGRRFFDQGLAVAATCVDCHGAHLQLRGTDPDSAISHKRILDTCSRCHTKIGKVHEKILKVALWKDQAWALPSCNVCHPVHKQKPAAATIPGVADGSCLQCHVGQGKGPPVDMDTAKASVHASISCAGCHSDVNAGQKERPCLKTGPVECANCHGAFGAEYAQSVHGKALAAGNKEAPRCPTCHGTHGIKFHMDAKSPTYRSAIPLLCGKCHGGKKPPTSISPMGAKAMEDYSRSVHGIEVLKKGHLEPAVCVDCHGAHGMRKSSDPASMVFRDAIPTTCGACHKDIYAEYSHGSHFIAGGGGKAGLPSCAVCHSAHNISKVSGSKFNREINHQCGVCHKDLARTYRETIHGKIHKLGYEKAAKCSDCHEAHAILPASNPRSSVAPANLMDTCGKCHKNVTKNFTGFIPHADYHSMEKRPYLFYTYWFMTLLLFGVFGFFGLHTLLWLPRSLTHAIFAAKTRPEPTGRYLLRFQMVHRVTHIFVIVSFLSLALTGMMLKYSYQPWAQALSQALGGVWGAGMIHRVAAVATFGYFIYHLRLLLLLKRESGLSWPGFIFGPGSMMFNLGDIRDFWRTMKWFLWMGPRPEYGRFTYWEKFDYFAVFWGVPIIGLSGLALWFPLFFTAWAPGWILNLAMIVHSDEALLAVGFIFTIHFFNTHLRPGAFPLDTVIFTGLVPEERYAEERKAEYTALKESGRLDEALTYTPFPAKWLRVAQVAGILFLALGIILIILIIKTALS
jgi:cytochrome b subunit of formate dehydrogenase